MLFNSIAFFFFLPTVFIAYWLCGKCYRLQNFVIVVVSYVFYGWWDWRFLILMFFSSLWAYVFGLFEINGIKGSFFARFRLIVSCVVNLGVLGYFKYFNFFVDQLQCILSSIGVYSSLPSLRVILPVGISFYTFQTLSYTIDVYRRTIVPTKDPIAFFAFISFFPQLVAGPIERAYNLLPQFLQRRTFQYALAVEGCRQMLLGFFKKVLVADSCAVIANNIFDSQSVTGIGLWVAAVFFAFQIYGDFSGYSDIAIGCSKLFGIRLMRNFNMPYFSRDIAEFWRRWHVSLTTWFRDYLYIPLGGSRCGILKKVRNTFIIFLVSGLWHGANWTFVVWGVFHAICFLPLLLLGNNRRYASDDALQVRMTELGKILLTFFLVVIGWTIFRAPDISTAYEWVTTMFSVKEFSLAGNGINLRDGFYALLFVIALLTIEWFGRSEVLHLPTKRWMRWMIYCGGVVLIVVFKPKPQEFIYFQF